MAERMTSIHLPGLPPSAGIADYGRHSAPEMLAQICARALIQKAHAEAILAACPSDFRVETYIGVHVQRDREIIQEGKSHD